MTLNALENFLCSDLSQFVLSVVMTQQGRLIIETSQNIIKRRRVKVEERLGMLTILGGGHEKL